MPTTDDLIARSVALKQAMIEFVMQPRFDRAVRKAIEQRFGPVLGLEETELLNFLDWFILQCQLPRGRTVVEQFVEAHPELPAEEREMLLGWSDVVEGIFEVKEQEGDALLLFNVLDELTYRAYSNVGPAIFAETPRGAFLNARLVPIRDVWMLSGSTDMLPSSVKHDIYSSVPQIASQLPRLVFRNPKKLARAWELQREEREDFIAY